MTVKKIQTTFALIATLMLALAFSSSTFAQSATVKAQITDRIAPAGSTCMVGDACASAQVVAAGEARSGEEIYNTACTMCHAAGIAGAPKLGDAAAWAPRLEQGLETLYAHSIDGFNGMPPRGMCTTCSDDEMHIVVDYMLEKSK